MALVRRLVDPNGHKALDYGYRPEFSITTTLQLGVMLRYSEASPPSID